MTAVVLVAAVSLFEDTPELLPEDDDADPLLEEPLEEEDADSTFALSEMSPEDELEKGPDSTFVLEVESSLAPPPPARTRRCRRPEGGRGSGLSPPPSDDCTVHTLQLFLQ